MAILLLAFLLLDILAYALLGLDIYLFREWYLHHDSIDEEYAHRCLIAAIALLPFLLSGRSIIRMILGNKRPGEDQPKVERSSNQEKLTRPDGTIINIEHYGKKENPAIVFIHGWNSNSMQWYYQKKYFEKNYHLILMDLAGLGKSTKPKNKDFSLEKLASDLDAVLEKTQALEPVLWGHSIGGMTILTYCKKFRSKLPSVKGIILEHTTYTKPTRTAIFSGFLTKAEKPLLRPFAWMMIIFSPLLWLSRWMSYLNGNMLIMTRPLTYAGSQTGKQLDFTSLLSAMAPPAVTARGVLGMLKYEAGDILDKINIPTLVVAAATDLLTKAEASYTMHEKSPGLNCLRSRQQDIWGWWNAMKK